MIYTSNPCLIFWRSNCIKVLVDTANCLYLYVTKVLGQIFFRFECFSSLNLAFGLVLRQFGPNIDSDQNWIRSKNKVFQRQNSVHWSVHISVKPPAYFNFVYMVWWIKLWVEFFSLNFTELKWFLTKEWYIWEKLMQFPR